jgi:hypothetical protein
MAQHALMAFAAFDNTSKKRRLVAITSRSEGISARTVQRQRNLKM